MSLATPHSQEVQISNPPNDGIGLTTSNGANIEYKDPVGQELTSSKDNETTLDHLRNKLENQSLNSNPIFERSTLKTTSLINPVLLIELSGSNKRPTNQEISIPFNVDS
ncbi:hypothetical protein ACH5RR_016515 [Cinchona calisaya]|uniref:Uncharacterized protein n=1 Tax=Cinchona calisaya TaxID=153742 RepID=A0ABD2ZW39_9GENT